MCDEGQDVLLTHIPMAQSDLLAVQQHCCIAASSTHLRPIWLLLKKCSLKSSTTSSPASLRTLRKISCNNVFQGTTGLRQSSHWVFARAMGS